MTADDVQKPEESLVVTSIQPPRASRRLVPLVLALIAFLATGCAALLPTGKTLTEGPWKSFDEAKKVFDGIEPGRTTSSELKGLGYDPYANANVSVLNYSDVLTRFAPSAVRDAYIEPGIRECLEAQAKCRAFSLSQQHLRRDRVGNFFLDFINFHRHTEITGWRFEAVIVLVDDHVVHKVWSGQREIREVEDQRNPLGPLQDQSAIVLPKR
jgi:hypothetical protein